MKQAPRRDMVIIVLVGLLAVTVILTVSLWSRSGSGRLTYHQCHNRMLELDQKAKAVERSAKPESKRAIDTVRVQLGYLMKYLQKRGEAHFDGKNRVWKRLDRIAVDIDAIEAGKNPFRDRKASLVRCYRSAIDGGPQPYILAVPPGYDRSKPMPLIVSLHEFSISDLLIDASLSERFNPNAIELRLLGRESADFRVTGAVDALKAIEDVAKDYAIDRSRIYLRGRSMGGSCCWWLAARYPDRFAAIAPSQGKSGYPAVSIDAKGPIKDTIGFLRSSLAPAAYAENLLHIPSYVMDGTSDRISPVAHSRAMSARLALLRGANLKSGIKPPGYSCTYWEFSGFDQGTMPLFARESFNESLLKHRLNPRPKLIRYKTDSLRHRKAYWLEIERLAKQNRFAEISANVDGRTMYARTSNVAAFAVESAACPLPAGKLVAKIDGDELPLPVRRTSKLHFVRKDSRWSLQPDARPARKAILSGPIEDVFRTPFMIVYGTQGDSARSSLKTEISTQAHLLARNWGHRYSTLPRIKSDMDVSSDDLAKYSLILFGGPDENFISLKFAESLPVKFADGAITLGDQTWSDSDVCVNCCSPNPENPERYLVVITSPGREGIFQVNNRFGSWSHWFDYAVYDSSTAGPDSFLSLGFFDQDWNLDPEQQWRRSARPEVVPRFVPAVKDGSRYVSEMWPTSAWQIEGAVTFDTDHAGGKLKLGKQEFDHGLGVRSGSEVIYYVPKGAESFKATVGIDPTGLEGIPAEEMGNWSLVFQVFIDGSLAANSGKVTASSSPVPMEVSVRGAERISLVVPPTARRGLLPRGVWADAMFVPGR